MQFTTAFVLAALPFLALASYPSDGGHGAALYRRSIPVQDGYITLERRADRAKTTDHKAQDWAEANSAHPQKLMKAGEEVSRQAMRAGAAGQDGMAQNANIRAPPHAGGSQPRPVVTTTTGKIGDQQVKTNHFGMTGTLQNPQWDGTNTQYVNDNKGKSKVIDPNARRYWDGPNKRSLHYNLLSRRSAEAIANAEAEAYADAYAAAYDDAYEEAFAMHKRDLEEQTLFARGLDGLDFDDLYARDFEYEDVELF